MSILGDKSCPRVSKRNLSSALFCIVLNTHIKGRRFLEGQNTFIAAYHMHSRGGHEPLYWSISYALTRWSRTWSISYTLMNTIIIILHEVVTNSSIAAYLTHHMTTTLTRMPLVGIGSPPYPFLPRATPQISLHQPEQS